MLHYLFMFLSFKIVHGLSLWIFYIRIAGCPLIQKEAHLWMDLWLLVMEDTSVQEGKRLYNITLYVAGLDFLP